MSGIHDHKDALMQMNNLQPHQGSLIGCNEMLSWMLNWSRMGSARLNELQRSIKKQIKNVKNGAPIQH